ncbi:hypothetical protein CC78DRAFT_576539 [Lojkania enalia]|uniref:Uncharacterized protein n=1 Tax=Lojkania enalia TaxID=147567 RepID=A0A9P4KF45_9PLEO|nr:hypothetical protein CC78DRAFT_576539 [Didymosphaeria enalia]
MGVLECLFDDSFSEWLSMGVLDISLHGANREIARLEQPYLDTLEPETRRAATALRWANEGGVVVAVSLAPGCRPLELSRFCALCSHRDTPIFSPTRCPTFLSPASLVIGAARRTSDGLHPSPHQALSASPTPPILLNLLPAQLSTAPPFALQTARIRVAYTRQSLIASLPRAQLPSRPRAPLLQVSTI